MKFNCYDLKNFLVTTLMLLIDIVILIMISINVYNNYNKEIIYSTKEYNIKTEIIINKENIDTTYIITRKK